MQKVLIYVFSLCLFALSVAQAQYPGDSARFRQLRKNMVSDQLQSRDIISQPVLDAMQIVPRHLFVPRLLRYKAYGDYPLLIGEGQTISQPYIVALMTQSLNLSAHDRVLEIGTGSGYQSAVLAQITQEVYTLEIKSKLYHKAAKTLKLLELINVYTQNCDGYFGWPQKAPFDAIMITAAINHIPPPLLQQLKDGGKLILPLGDPFSYQNLVMVTKTGQDFIIKQITGVLFVPMTGHALTVQK